MLWQESRPSGTIHRRLQCRSRDQALTAPGAEVVPGWSRASTFCPGAGGSSLPRCAKPGGCLLLPGQLGVFPASQRCRGPEEPAPIRPGAPALAVQALTLWGTGWGTGCCGVLRKRMGCCCRSGEAGACPSHPQMSQALAAASAPRRGHHWGITGHRGGITGHQRIRAASPPHPLPK